MQLIDSHVHINFDVFESDLDEVRQRWREAGVTYLVHSCVEPAEFGSIAAIAKQFPEVFFAVSVLLPSEIFSAPRYSDAARLA